MGRDDLEERADSAGRFILAAIFLGPLCALNIYKWPVPGAAGTLLGVLTFGIALRRLKPTWLQIPLVVGPLLAAIPFPPFGLAYLGGMFLAAGISELTRKRAPSPF